MSALVPREKLAAVLGMLGSEHDGEVLAAARAAERLRAQAGATWAELLGAAVARQRDQVPGWRAMVAACLAHRELLTDWERQFVSDLRRQARLSRKQLAILSRIAAGVRQ
jgi:hypothetical protein